MKWWNPATWRKSISQGGGTGIFFPTVSEPFMASTYQMFAAEGFGLNSTVNMCVRLVGGAIGGLPVKIFRDVIGADGEAEEVFIDNHPAWRFIGERGKPNDRQSWPQFVLAYFAYAYLDGNNYIFAAGDVRDDVVRRVASAVGQGSIAVSFVHQYLKTV